MLNWVEAIGQQRLATRVFISGLFAIWLWACGSAEVQPAPAPRTHPTESVDDDSSERVGGEGSGFVSTHLRERHRVLAQGRQPVTGVFGGTLDTNGVRRIPFPVTGQHCYTVLGAAVPSVRGLHVRVRDPHGNEPAVSTDDGAEPALDFCASVGETWELEVRMFQGYGRYGVQIYGSES